MRARPRRGKKKKKPKTLRGVNFVYGFDKEEERVIGVFKFRDESGVVDEVSRE